MKEAKRMIGPVLILLAVIALCWFTQSRQIVVPTNLW